MTEPTRQLHARLTQHLHEITVTSGAPAAVLATVTRGRTEVVSHGDPPPDAHTTFEIGSITKTFTALLLAVMAHRGEVDYQDPISAYLPPHAIPLGTAAAGITLEQLATHTAGLPLHPANLEIPDVPGHPNPYADYRLDDLYQATSSLELASAPGTRVDYSTFGIGLLGQLLVNAAHRDYPDLVSDRVCVPLGMNATVALPGPNCATGHRQGRPTPPLEMHALASAGVLRSSVTDLLRYLTAQLHPQSTPLTDALRAAQRPYVAIEDRQSMCLVWMHRRFRFGDVLFHSGGTPGFTAFVGFCPQTNTGVITLANARVTEQSTLVQTSYDLLKTLAKETPTAAA